MHGEMVLCFNGLWGGTLEGGTKISFVFNDLWASMSRCEGVSGTCHGAIGGGIAAVAVGNKAFRSGQRAFGRKGAGAAPGGLAGGPAPVPVVVTNFPPNPGGAAGGRGGRGRSGAIGRFGQTTAGAGAGAALARRSPSVAVGGRLTRLAGRAAVPLAAMVSALSLLDTLTDKDLSAIEKGGGVGSAAGGLGGAAGGAALGTLLLPGIGTVLGALIGGLSGDLLGERIGRAVVRGMKEEPTGPGRPSSLSGQTRRLRIEAEGLPPGSALEIETDDPDLELDTGPLMDTMG
jgi:hypothetical protein